MPTIPPAPLDPAQLELSLAPFGSSRMLPRDAYLAERRAGVGARASVRGLDVSGPLGRDQAGRAARGVRRRLRRTPHPRQGGRAARLRERLPAPRPRAAALRRLRATRGRSSAPTTPGPTGTTAACIGAPHFKDVEYFDKSTLGLKPVPVARVARLGVRRPVGHGAGLRRAHRRARGDRRAVRRGVTWSPPRPTRTTSRPTGRSSSRTTRSATTAR